MVVILVGLKTPHKYSISPTVILLLTLYHVKTEKSPGKTEFPTLPVILCIHTHSMIISAQVLYFLHNVTSLFGIAHLFQNLLGQTLLPIPHHAVDKFPCNESEQHRWSHTINTSHWSITLCDMNWAHIAIGSCMKEGLSWELGASSLLLSSLPLLCMPGDGCTSSSGSEATCAVLSLTVPRGTTERAGCLLQTRTHDLDWWNGILVTLQSYRDWGCYLPGASGFSAEKKRPHA